MKRVGSNRQTTAAHHASIIYRYTVEGQEYTSGQLGFGPTDNYSFLARALLDRYPPGQTVTVYHDPADPRRAVLQREVLFGGYIYGLVGLFVGFIGLRLLLLALMPTVATTNSRWLPWSQRLTWPDLPLLIVGAIGLALWIPMLFGM